MELREKWCVSVGAVLAGLAVAFGAFGAHGLREVLSEARLEVWQTAAGYQLVHGVALVALGGFAGRLASSWVVLASSLIGGGVVVFSGSLYLLCLLDVGILGAVTPVGGVLMLLGWGALVAGVWRVPKAAGVRGIR